MIYHIVQENDFRSCNDGEKYLPVNFHENGFVHCALETSVLPVANDYYADVTETLLLLRIEPLRLISQTKYESPVPEKGASTLHISSSPVFPHVYGPIDNSAVNGVGVLVRGQDGYIWPKEFIPLSEYFRSGNKIVA
jgi:uncharacterized protein (DUF952 family)